MFGENIYLFIFCIFSHKAWGGHERRTLYSQTLKINLLGLVISAYYPLKLELS